MGHIIQIAVWVMFAVIFAVIYINKFKGKKKYKDAEFNNDEQWLEHSLEKYPDDPSTRRYFLHFDKDYLHQGQILEDENHNVVYEVKVLYANGFSDDEVDFINHIINYTHHHTIGKTVTTSFESGNAGVTMTSTFKFDHNEVFSYLNDLGYDFHFNFKLLAYTIDITKNGEKVGTIYSSNNGKNLYEREGNEIIPKAGGAGIYVLECDYSNLDILLLYGVIFARVEFSMKTLK